MTNTENLEALETQIQNWIEKQNRIAKEMVLRQEKGLIK